MKKEVKYENISAQLAESNIFFTTNGSFRHKPLDIIVYDDEMKGIEPYSCFLRGNNIYPLGSFSFVKSIFPINTKIGRYCSIGEFVTILGGRHPIEWVSSSSSTYDRNFIIFKKFADDSNQKHTTYARNPFSTRKHGLVIEHDVWIGNNAVLKGDIRIGTGAVVAANSVVIKDVPPYAIVGGNPAKIIKYRFSDYQIMRLLESRWWEYAFTDVQSIDIRDIDSFLDIFEKEKHKFVPFVPNKFILSIT